jgi:hypothetical protein
MLGWYVKRRIAEYERTFNYDMDYARYIFDASPRAFFLFSRLTGLARYREGAPREAWFAVKIVAAMGEDCGPCTQLVVAMAEKSKVDPAVLRAIVAGDIQALPSDAALGYRFAKAVLAHDIAESDRLRADVLARWGKKALVSLALGIGISRVFPTVKYALGHGHACTRIQVSGADAPLAVRSMHV